MNYKDLENQWYDNTDYLICNTSGSTGNPKKIKLSKQLIKESAQRTNAFFGIDSNSHLYSCISPEFIGGKMMMIRALEADCRFSWETPTNRPLEGYAGPKIDLLSIVPSQMLHILDHPEIQSFIRKILIGGAPLSDKTANDICAANIEAWESYGMTETASHVALRRISTHRSPFRTLGDIKVTIDGSSRLIINMGDGIVLTTNDIAEVISDTEFFIIGRYDNVINSGGKKIHPEDLESRLASVIPNHFAITSIEDPKWGEKVILVLNAFPANLATLYEEMRKVCKSHELPKSVVILNEIPTTANNKINRPILRNIARKSCDLIDMPKD